MEKFITSESVNIGHPDKTCDYIADCFLDAALLQDSKSQMAVECAIKNNKLFVYGEATTKANLDYDQIARDALKEIGYSNEFEIIKEISAQSPDINQAVVKKNLCANDQGIVFGYATNQTPQFMPLSIVLAHEIMKKYDDFRKTNKNFFPDAKSQVTVKVDGNFPKEIAVVLISVSHDEKLELENLQKTIQKQVLEPVLQPYKNLCKNTKFIINPSGKFTIWGSFSDSGCVGRKIVVDTYGSVGRVGGGCFSSKNATKVDRSGAYFARYVAKNIVANNLADECEVQLCFGIGLERPISVSIDCFGTNKIPLEKLQDVVAKNFDFSLNNIIKELDLLKPIYKHTACFGHFGRDEFAWEKVKKLKI